MEQISTLGHDRERRSPGLRWQARLISEHREPGPLMRRQTVMRLLVLSIVALVVGVVSAPPASADCSAPSMTFSPHDVVRGGEVIATGKAWGDNCYDTGPPPDGEGVLGRPVTDIDIVVVQGEEEWIVATIDADDDYRFTTPVNVPQDATPGDAQMIARKAGTLPYVSNPDPDLRISNAPAVTPPPTDNTLSTNAPDPEAATAENESGSQAVWLTVVAAVVVALAAGTWVVTVRRRSS